MRYIRKTLKTEHLILRRPYLTDIDDLFVCTSNPNVTKYEGWRKHNSPMETLNFVNSLMECMELKCCNDYVIVEKESDRAIGIINLHDIDYEKDEGYIGYWIAEDCWHKGYATEAVAAFIGFMTKECKVRKILALCHPLNVYSAKALVKNGFEKLGTRPCNDFLKREDETYTETADFYGYTPPRGLFAGFISEILRKNNR